MKNQQQSKGKGFVNRRSGNERRVYESDLGYPFVDSHGLLVTEDRRKVTDRREDFDSISQDALGQLALGEQSA